MGSLLRYSCVCLRALHQSVGASCGAWRIRSTSSGPASHRCLIQSPIITHQFLPTQPSSLCSEPLTNSGRENKINQLHQKIMRPQYRFKYMKTVLQRTRGGKKKYIACCFLHRMWTGVIFDGRIQIKGWIL